MGTHRGHTLRSSGTALALTALALTFIVASAAATTLGTVPSQAARTSGTAHGFKYVTQSRKAELGGVSLVHTGCGPGWLLAGGGGRISGTAGPGDDRHLHGNFTYLTGETEPANPSLHSTSFGVLGPGPKSKITTNAICVRRRSPGTVVKPQGGGEFVVKAGGMRYVHVGVEPSGVGPESVDAGCGKGREVLGGASNASTDVGHLNATYPIDGADSNETLDDGWQGFMFDAQGDGSPDVQAFCQSRDAPIVKTLTYVAGDPETMLAPGSATAVARCTSNRSVAGGGVFVSGSVPEAMLVRSVPIDLGDPDNVPDDGWSGKALNQSGLGKTVVAHAICGRA